MQETKKFVEKFSTRLSNVRNERLDFLWNDFLSAIEKVINTLTDEQLAAANCIGIFYKAKENDDCIYRSKSAEIDCFDEELDYESDDICLGTKNMLQNAFKDVKEKAKHDNYCGSDWFEVERLFDSDEEERIILDFYICNINIEFKKTQSNYRIIPETTLD